jgi:hypothetical protein
VAGLFDGFEGLNDYRAHESGAEWVSQTAQAMTMIARVPLDGCCTLLPSDEPLLRIWSPRFIRLGLDAPVEVTLEKVRRFPPAQARQADAKQPGDSERHLTLNLRFVSEPIAYERVYVLSRSGDERKSAIGFQGGFAIRTRTSKFLVSFSCRQSRPVD